MFSPFQFPCFLGKISIFIVLIPKKIVAAFFNKRALAIGTPALPRAPPSRCPLFLCAARVRNPRLLSRVPPRQNFDLAEVSGVLTEFTHVSFTTGRIVLLAFSPLVGPVLSATMAQVPLLAREQEWLWKCFA